MERKKVKIENMNKSKITLNLLDITGRIVKINGSTTANITEDELTYLINNSNAIHNGNVRVANEDVLSEYVDKTDLETPNCLTDEEINALLRKSQKNVEKEIANIDSFDTVEKILNKANELNKSVNMVAIIEKRLNELRK